MTYRNNHYVCKENNCKTYTTYIRIKNKWTPIGEYHTACKTFTSTSNTEEDKNRAPWTVDDSLYAKELEEKFQKARQEFIQSNTPEPEQNEDLSTLINSLH